MRAVPGKQGGCVLVLDEPELAELLEFMATGHYSMPGHHPIAEKVWDVLHIVAKGGSITETPEREDWDDYMEHTR